MRKAWVLAGVVVAVAIAAWLMMDRNEVPGPSGDAPAVTESTQKPQRNVAPEKLNAVLLQPVKAQTGAGTIRGKVLSRGEPVAGATITATRAETKESLSERSCECDNACGQKLLACGCGEASEQLKTLVTERSGEVIPVGRSVTATDGTFEITQLDPGEVALWADSPRLGTSLQQHVAVGSDNVALQLGDGVALKGKVTIDGEPAPANAWVTAIHGEQSRFFDVLTQGDGSFTIGPLPVGLYSLVAGAPGALPGHQHLRKDSPTEGFEIALYTPRVITGVVELDGKPVSGVAVKMSGNHRESQTVSGGDGSFRFTELRPGSHQLSALKGALRSDVTVKVPRRGNPDLVRLTLTEGARLVGTVRSAKGPIAKAKVNVRSMNQEDEVETDLDGKFELQTFAGSGANLFASAEGFVAKLQNADLISGKDTRVDFVLVPEARIAGIVFDTDGNPLPGARLMATPEEGHDGSRGDESSQDGGTFEIKGLSAAAYQVTVSHPEHATLTTRVVAPAVDLKLRLEDGLAVDGVVVDEADHPVVAKVSVLKPGDDNSHDATSGADGRFRVRGLTAGPQTIHADATEGSTSKELNLSGHEAPVRLVLEGFGTISGTVVDTADKPVADAGVMAFSKEGRDGSANSQSNGAFTLPKLKRGAAYTVVAMATDGPPDSEPVAATSGQTGVKLVVKPSFKVRGRVVDTEGKPLPEARVNDRPVEAWGRFELRLTPTGTMRLRVTALGYAGVLKVVRVEGKDVDVGDLQLGGRALQLVVLDASTGKPLSRATVWMADDWKTGQGEPAAETDADGKTTVRGLATTGAVLIVNHDTHSPLTVPIEDAANEKTVRLEAGATIDIKVTDASGKPVATEVTALEGETGRAVSLPTDRTGAVKFEGMAKGKWTFLAKEARGAARAQQVVQVPERGVVPLTLALKTGAASFSLVLSPGLDAIVLVFPPGVRAPTRGADLSELWAMAIETKHVGNRITVEGLDVGTHLAVILKQHAGGMKMFSTTFDVTSASQQSVTLQEGTWTDATME